MEIRWKQSMKKKETVILKKAEKWLDTYFMGRCPEKKLPLHLQGTEFQKAVWAILFKYSLRTDGNLW